MNYSSDHFNGKIFLNPVPTDVMQKGAFGRILKMYLQKNPDREPAKPLGPFNADLSSIKNLPEDVLRVTWLGHSGSLIEIDGKRFLTDPLWYQRASPFNGIGPKRFFQNPITLNNLPAIDAVLLSHDHYDHLDKEAILHLTSKNIPVITMLGVGKRLTSWGVEEKLVTELDWWQQTQVDDVTITALPSRHFSGRWLRDRFSTLWGSFAVKGHKHNIYFGADSGYYDGFKKIGDKLGPFDLTMLDTGAYNKEWESIHMGPENAVQAHIDLQGKILMPIHWGMFSLAFHTWTEPAERVMKAAAAERNVELLLPTPGETVTVDNGPYNSFWWKAKQ